MGWTVSVRSPGFLFWEGVAHGEAAPPREGPVGVPMSIFTPPAPSRKEEAVRELENSSPLVISIALGCALPPPRPPPRHPAGQQPLCRGRWHPPASCAPAFHLALPCTRAQGGLAPPSGTAHRLLERQNFDIPGGRHKLNPSQTGAVREALKKQFTVIQGPPGRATLGVGACRQAGGGSVHPILCPQARGRRWWAST